MYAVFFRGDRPIAENLRPSLSPTIDYEQVRSSQRWKNYLSCTPTTLQLN